MWLHGPQRLHRGRLCLGSRQDGNSIGGARGECCYGINACSRAYRTIRYGFPPVDIGRTISLNWLSEGQERREREGFSVRAMMLLPPGAVAFEESPSPLIYIDTAYGKLRRAWIDSCGLPGGRCGNPSWQTMTRRRRSSPRAGGHA